LNLRQLRLELMRLTPELWRLVLVLVLRMLVLVGWAPLREALL